MKTLRCSASGTPPPVCGYLWNETTYRQSYIIRELIAAGSLWHRAEDRKTHVQRLIDSFSLRPTHAWAQPHYINCFFSMLDIFPSLMMFADAAVAYTVEFHLTMRSQPTGSSIVKDHQHFMATFKLLWWLTRVMNITYAGCRARVLVRVTHY